MFDLFLVLVEIQDKVDVKFLVVVEGVIYFCDVCFYYDLDWLIFKGIDFYVLVGYMIVIVGLLGVGKLIILWLLFWFYDVIGGFVEIDGQDVCDVM